MSKRDSIYAFDYEDRKELERVLDEIPFLSYHMGPCVNEILHQAQHCRGAWQGSLSAVKNFLLIGAATFEPIKDLLKTDVLSPGDSSKRHLFTSIGPKPHYRAMILNVLQRFSNREACVLSSVSLDSVQDFNRWPSQDRNALKSGFSIVNSFQLIAYLSRCFGKVRRFASLHRLGVPFVIAIMAALANASVNVVRFRRYLERLRPITITTEYDRVSWVAALMVAARSLNIPTQTLQHGAIGGPCWGPLVADHMLCWGEDPRDQLICNDDIDPARIHLVGNVLLPDRLASSASEGHHRLLLATNPIELSQRLRETEMVAAVATRHSKFSLTVKLHPSEKLSDYSALLASFPHVRFLDRAAGIGDALVADADVLICGNTSLGLIAMHLRIPVILIAEQISSLGQAGYWLKQGAALHVADYKQLDAALSEIGNRSPLIQRQLEEASSLANRLFSAGGAAASDRIERFIRSRVSSIANQSACARVPNC